MLEAPALTGGLKIIRRGLRSGAACEMVQKMGRIGGDEQVFPEG